ncbi:MAG: hypothetical protein NVS2B16_19070 [Chloroflexota bacterium]
MFRRSVLIDGDGKTVYAVRCRSVRTDGQDGIHKAERIDAGLLHGHLSHVELLVNPSASERV